MQKEMLYVNHEPKFSMIATVQETDFARRLAIGVPVPDAYSQSGLGPGKTRKQCWSRGANLAKTKRIEERMEYYSQLATRRMDIREDRILAELASIAFSDPADFVDTHGAPLDIREMPPHARAAINIIDSGLRPDRTPYIRLKLNDKLKALQMLVKIKNMEQAHQSASAPTIEIGFKQGATYEDTD
jgi:hypothetical protein